MHAVAQRGALSGGCGEGLVVSPTVVSPTTHLLVNRLRHALELGRLLGEVSRELLEL